jgi:hypothetical protein
MNPQTKILSNGYGAQENKQTSEVLNHIDSASAGDTD